MGAALARLVAGSGLKVESGGFGVVISLEVDDPAG
jgi:hypothetical protein